LFAVNVMPPAVAVVLIALATSTAPAAVSEMDEAPVDPELSVIGANVAEPGVVR
jgi:hypothetical protein